MTDIKETIERLAGIQRRVYHIAQRAEGGEPSGKLVSIGDDAGSVRAALITAFKELEVERDRLREALAPFASVAEHDIGDDETDADVFHLMARFNRGTRLKVGHLRAARAALEPKP